MQFFMSRNQDLSFQLCVKKLRDQKGFFVIFKITFLVDFCRWTMII